MSRLWDPTPIHITIVELLERMGGSSTDTDLYKELESYHEGLNFRAFNKALMKLEIGGIIRVASLTKKQRRIELIRMS